MFKSFLVSMFAIFLFTLGAAGAWFYIQMTPTDESHDESSIDVAGQIKAEPDPIPKFNPGGDLPAVLRGPDLDPDDLVRLNMAMSARQEQSRQHAEKLREIRVRIQTTNADTQAAQREVEGAMGQARKIMDTAEKLLDEIQTALADLKKQAGDLQKRKDEIGEIEKNIGEDTAANTKTFAEFLEKMPPETASDTFKEMIRDNKMDYVIQLLRNMEPRNVSKVLAVFEDSTLVAEIATRYSSTTNQR